MIRGGSAGKRTALSRAGLAGGDLPGAFARREKGFVDALVMYQSLSEA